MNTLTEIEQHKQLEIVLSIYTFSIGNGDKFCQGKTDGHYRDPRDCRKFYQCSFGLAFHEICGGGTVFNVKIFGCDFPSHVHGCEKVLSNIFG